MMGQTPSDVVVPPDVARPVNLWLSPDFGVGFLSFGCIFHSFILDYDLFWVVFNFIVIIFFLF